MQTFTLHSRHYLSVLFLALLQPISLYLPAQQSHTVMVSNPSSVLGKYQAAIANFGPAFCETDTIIGELVLAEDIFGDNTACNAITSDLEGKIALIDRGDCLYSPKVYNAQLSGAIAVIVTDNEDVVQYTTMEPSAGAELITIPSFFMRKADSDVIRSRLAEGLELSIIRNDRTDDFTGEIVYEEDFNGGLNGWQTTVGFCSGAHPDGVELWKWKGNGLVEGPCANNGRGFLPGFPTQCNGFVAFESDLADSGGGICGEQVGAGSCPIPHGGALISPVIDLSPSGTNAYAIRFKQHTRNFLSDYYVGWSFDEGLTWDSTAVNTEVDINSFNSVEDSELIIPLPGSMDADNVMIRFYFLGQYYYWAIDEVQIVVQPANDLRVNPDFYAVAPNLITPVSQVEPFVLLANIENIGSAVQDDVNLNFTMLDADSQVVYIADLPYNTIPANTLVENIPFAEKYTPTEVGIYTGTYRISAALGDADSSDNVQSFVMGVHEEVFAKEVGANLALSPNPNSWPEGEPRSWAFGNYYYVPNGAGFFLKDVTFALGNPKGEAGQSFQISLYEWAQDLYDDGEMDPEDRVLQGFTSYTITGQEAVGEPITVPFPGSGEPIALKDDTEYVLMIEYNATNSNDLLTLAAASTVDYTAQVAASRMAGTPRYASMLGIGSDLSLTAYTSDASEGFGYNIVPVLRMSITNVTSSANQLVDLSNEFAVYPNPANEQISLQLALQEQDDNTLVRIVDLAGKTLLQRNYQNIQHGVFRYYVGEFPAGTYLLQVITNKGTGIKKFVVNQ